MIKKVFQNLYHWILWEFRIPREYIPYLLATLRLWWRLQTLPQQPDETVVNFNSRMSRVALQYFATVNIILGLTSGIRIGIYTVSLSELYGKRVYDLQSVYFATMMIFNIVMGVMADSIIGRRVVLLVGSLCFACSYLLHSMSTYSYAIVGEVFYGFGEACITGILGAWLRHTLEHHKGSDYKKYYAKASYRVFGTRYITMSVVALMAGNMLPMIGNTRIWYCGTGFAIILSAVIYIRMFWRPIATPPRKRKGFLETLSRSLSEILRNVIVRKYFMLGTIQYAVWSLLAVSWLATFRSSIPAWLSIFWIAGASTLFSSIGSWIVTVAEKKKHYATKNSDEQQATDFRWMRMSHLLGGVCVILAVCVGGSYGIYLYLGANIFRGIFARKFAGAITLAVSSRNKKFGTTILSWFETIGSAGRLSATTIGGKIEQYTIPENGWNFILAGFIMSLSGGMLLGTKFSDMKKSLTNRIRRRKTVLEKIEHDIPDDDGDTL